MANLFESETCSRCGGSGHYSYCQRYGTTCFKCAGRKEVLTKRGAAAQRLYTRLLSRPAYTLKPGESIWVDCVFSGAGWSVITGIEPDVNNGGLTIHTKRLTLVGENPERVHRVRGSVQVCEWAKMIALAYQAILSKTGKEPAWLSTVAWG